MRKLDELKRQGWDIEMRDFERLIASLSDLTENIASIKESVDDSSGVYSDVISKIPAAVESLKAALPSPKRIEGNLSDISKKYDALAAVLNKINDNITGIAGKEPEKMGVYFKELSARLESVLKSSQAMVKSVLEQAKKDNAELISRLDAILNKPLPAPIRIPSWDFEVVRDYDTGLIKRIIAQPK